MTPAEAARAAFAERRWTAAVDAYGAAGALPAEDLERLAVAAYLTGRDDTSASAFERAHRARLDAGELDAAVRDGFWLGLTAMLRGDMAQASGWFARSGRLVEEHQPAGSGPGYLMTAGAVGALHEGDARGALERARAADAVARAHADADLGAFAVCAAGQALVALDEPAEACRHFDEAMVSVTSGEVSPIPAGIVYCAVIAECVGLLDVRRAWEWTESLNRWCAEQQDLVPYRGQCRVHRSQMLQLHGDWVEAEAEADRARTRLADPFHPALGLACYQRGELHRLRGEFDDAAEAYRAGNDHGHEPMPGLALLRLAEGNVDAAAGAIRRAVDESGGNAMPALLAAAVEILHAAGDHAGAGLAGDRLATIATARETPVVTALSAHAQGRLAWAAGRPSDALGHLRSALRLWRELEMPYEAARTRELVGLACHDAGDLDGCALELDAARRVYEALGAGPDAARVARAIDGAEPARRADAGLPAGLTARECDVLRLVAAGLTNRQIGEQLAISEHTVARHVQNMFTKLGVSSRSAATAFAFQHGLA